MQASSAPLQAPDETTIDAVTAQLSAVIKHAMLRTQGQMLAAVEELGISLSQLKALGVLEPEQTLSLGGLADQLQLSHPAVSRLVDSLVKRGWVTREEAPEDRRCKLIQITPEGLATYRELAALRISGLRAFVETLTPTELDALAPGLQRLAQRPEIAAHMTEEVTRP
jgi:MarR family transcriptional regulator, 2-MHQ and catechol-resistance regulon repressor